MEVGAIERKAEFGMNAEFEISTRSKAVVADHSQLNALDAMFVRDDEWEWQQGANVATMHPLWFVRRLAERQLQKERMDTKLGQPTPFSNCEIKRHCVSNVCVSSHAHMPLNRARLIGLRCLTNFMELSPGDELIVKVDEKVAKHLQKGDGATDRRARYRVGFVGAHYSLGILECLSPQPRNFCNHKHGPL